METNIQLKQSHEHEREHVVATVTPAGQLELSPLGVGSRSPQSVRHCVAHAPRIRHRSRSNTSACSGVHAVVVRA